MSKGEQTRTAIVDAAARQAAVGGLQSVSIGGLAAELGLSKSGLFGHFGAKDALQQAVLERLVERFVDTVVRPALARPTGLARLEALADGLIEWSARRHPRSGCPIAGLSLELDAQPGPLRDFLADQQRAFRDTVMRLARKCVDEGTFRPDTDPGQFAFEFAGIEFGFNHARVLLQDPAAETRARAAFRRLIDDARA